MWWLNWFKPKPKPTYTYFTGPFDARIYSDKIGAHIEFGFWTVNGRHYDYRVKNPDKA